MKSTRHPLTDIVQQTLSWERACANLGIAHLRRSNTALVHHDASTSGQNRPQVKQIAVRYASQVPQSSRKAGITPEGSCKSLKVNREIKAHLT